jgi:hypothetical protein
VVEIREVETHFALSGGGDFDQSAAQGGALERAAEHHAADQIEHNVRALVPGRRANLRRQVLGADDQRLCYGANRCVRKRRALVSTDYAGAEAPIDSTVSPGFRPAASMPHHAAT